MANPKKKKSRSKRNSRRSHHALSAMQTVTCPNCQAMVIPHRVCPSCGYFYKNNKRDGRTVVETEA